MATSAERLRNMLERDAAAGIARVTVRVPEEVVDELKVRAERARGLLPDRELAVGHVLGREPDPDMVVRVRDRLLERASLAKAG